jgi:hypothetical protein
VQPPEPAAQQARPGSRRSRLPFPGQAQDHRAHRYIFKAFRHRQFDHRAFVDGFHFHGGLVGFDFGDDVAGFYGLPKFHMPFGQRAHFHGGRQGGHGHINSHDQLSTKS